MPLPTNREKRRRRFAAAQASLSPEELETQQQQNMEIAHKPLAHTTLYMLKLAKKWFIEFMEDEHPGINAQDQYFASGSPEPDHVLMKEYARYLARSRIGRITGTLKINSIIGYISSLLWAMERETNRMYNPQLRNQLGVFISHNLAEQEGLSTASNPKPIAYAEDVSFIVSKLYDSEYLGTFANMRMVLNLTLYIMLVIDTCGRGGEIARINTRPEHMCLRWEDISFYSFQSTDNDTFDIRANIKIRWGKNDTLDDSKYKIIPFARLLPASMALEDTLRLLINTALMDGVFDEGVHSWGDLSRIRLPPSIAKTGRRIQLKQNMLEVPVLRRMLYHRLTTDPVQMVDLPPLISRLGQYCGIEHRLIGYCFRRGAAYVLAMNVSDDMRRFLMGHAPGSNTYAKHYQSLTSTVDFPSMFRGLQQVSTLAQGSVLLNRSDTAPLKLSCEGLRRVMAHPDVQKEDATLDSIRSDILEKYPTIAEARRQGDLLAKEYDDSFAVRRSHVDILKNRYYREEYNAHFANTTATGNLLDTNQPASRSVHLDAVQSSSTQPPADSGPHPSTISSAVAQRTGDTQAYPDEIANASDDNDQVGGFLKTVDADFLDNVTWSDLLHEEDERAREIMELEQQPTSSNSRLDVYDDSSPVNSLPSSGDISTPATTQSDVSLQTAASPHESITRRVHGRGTSRVTGRGVSAYNDMKNELAMLEDDPEAHSACMIKWFTIAHPIDQFPPGQEPVIGTYLCCAKNPETGRIRRKGPTFEDQDQLLAHMWSEHHAAITKTPEVYFCWFCQIWLIKPHEWRTHSATHLDDAQNIASTIGYAGVSAGRTIVPRICPLCLHDESLPTFQRVRAYQTLWDLWHHVRTHLQNQKKDDSRQQCPCYPTNCGKVDEMDSVEMEEHLKEAHGMASTQENKTKKRRNPLGEVSGNAGPSRAPSKKTKINESEE
ncbi:hypothetical protein ACHAPQ_007393 [Fusarium lateritium]